MFSIGTRGSHLATTQSGHVRDALGEHGYPAELQVVTTPGDLSPVSYTHLTLPTKRIV